MKQIAENHPNWKGGRYIDSAGYVAVRIDVNKYQREHRVVFERHLGRPLKSCEIVHHKNGNKQDNRIENLLLTNHSDHTKLHWETGSLQSFGRTERPMSDCHPDREHYAKGLCSLCYMRLKQREFAVKNPDKIKETRKRYQQANRDKINAYKRHRRALGLSS